MPTLNEGTLLYMPASLPGMSVTKAAELLQTPGQDHPKFSRSSVRLRQSGTRANCHRTQRHSKCSRPLSTSNPSRSGVKGLTTDKLIAELDKAVQIPGISNAWTMPIKARTDMLSTGIRTPIGIKIFGKDLDEMEG